MFDVSDVPSFDLSLLFSFLCASALALTFAFALAFAFLFPHTFECITPRLTYLHHSESCGLCASVTALIVSRSVSTFCASYCRTGLLQGLTSASRERTLQQLHQHRSISTSVHRLPHFQKSSPDLESIHWIAQSRDHLICSIFRVHHQHERKLVRSLLLSIVHVR